MRKDKKLKMAVELLTDELSEKFNNAKELNKPEKELLLDSISNLRKIREQLALNDRL